MISAIAALAATLAFAQGGSGKQSCSKGQALDRKGSCSQCSCPMNKRGSGDDRRGSSERNSWSKRSQGENRRGDADRSMSKRGRGEDRRGNRDGNSWSKRGRGENRRGDAGRSFSKRGRGGKKAEVQADVDQPAPESVE